MRDFKFFRKEVKTSIHSDTPEGVMLRRHLYHTNPQEYRRVMGLSVEEGYNSPKEGEEYLSSFHSLSETKWERIESTFRKLFFQDDVIGTILVSTVSTLSMILILTKILNVW
jgi:hypothetical protein